MSNKPWKQWKTRKTTLVFSIICIVIYIIIGIIMGFLDHTLDSTLTEQVFSFFKWLTMTGCLITVSKIVKGKTNSDCNEDELDIPEYNEETDDIEQ